MENYGTETVDYLNDNFNVVEKELEKITANELIKIEIDDELETAIKELELLKTQMPEKQTATLLEMCKDNVIETVFGQFGLSALFLSSKDGGNVTTLHNAQKDIFANENDKERFNRLYDKDVYHDKNSRYVDKRNELKNLSASNSLYDDYTGKNISGKAFYVDKNGVAREKERFATEHYVAAKEVHDNNKVKLFMTEEQSSNLANSEKNLGAISSSINSSKIDTPFEEWKDKSSSYDPNIKNAETYGVDRKMAQQKVTAARKYMNKEITKAQFRKYSTELMATGATDAAMIVASSAFGVILRDLCSGIMTEVRITFEKKGTESFKEIFRRFKARLQSLLSELKHKWREILPASFGQGIIAFLSNIVVFVINLFATTLKKIVMMIRAGFMSLCEAVKMLTHPPVGMTREDANFQAMKILTAGLIGAASLGLSAAIEKLLQSIPGLQPLMFFPIPSFGGEQRTVSDILAVTISSLVGGVISTIVLYFMDRARENSKRCKWQIQMVTQSGVVVQCQIAKTWCTLDEGYRFLYQRADEMDQIFSNTKHMIDESSAAVEKEFSELDSVMEKLRNI